MRESLFSGPVLSIEAVDSMASGAMRYGEQRLRRVMKVMRVKDAESRGIISSDFQINVVRLQSLNEG